jgi:drug/metabolite transporter (DMT)-like permease
MENPVGMSPRALGVLLLLGCVWGASFLFIKVVVEETSPLALVQARITFGALAAVALMALGRRPFEVSPRLWAKVAVVAVLTNIVPWLLISWGEIHIESGTASVLNSTMPLFTAFFAGLILVDERLTWVRLSGLALGFVGVVVLAGGDIIDVTDSSVVGQLAVVGASACYGAGAVYIRILLRSEDPFNLVRLQLLIGAIILAPALFAVDGVPNYNLSLEAWLCLITLGTLGTGLAYLAYTWLIGAAGAVTTSLVTYVIPIVGLILGWAVLDESVGINSIAGCGLILLGITAVLQRREPLSGLLPGRLRPRRVPLETVGDPPDGHASR